MELEEKEVLETTPTIRVVSAQQKIVVSLALLLPSVVTLFFAFQPVETNTELVANETTSKTLPQLDFTSIDVDPAETPPHLPAGAEDAHVYGHEKNGVFYRIGDTVHYYRQGDPNIALQLTDANPNTFTYLSGAIGYDDAAIYKIDQTLGGGSYSRGREYQIFTIPINESQSALTKSYDLDTGINVIWRDNVNELLAPLKFSDMTGLREWNTGLFYTTITDANGAVVEVLTSQQLNPSNSFHAVEGKLIILGNEHIFSAEPQGPIQILLATDANKITYNHGAEELYYTASFGSPTINKLNLLSGATSTIFSDVSNRYHRSTRIHLSPDGSKLYFSGVRFEDPDNPVRYTEEYIDFIEINTDSLATNISDFGTLGKGGLAEIAMSPNNQLLYATVMPYEGYSFRELRYRTRNIDGTWSTEPSILQNFHTEVGGGWNINTNQWLLSPQKTHMIITDAEVIGSGNCGGMGDAPSIQNQIKLLDLDTQKMRVLTSAGPLNEYNLLYWEQDESGVYFTLNTYEESDCSYKERGDIQFLPITL